MENLFTQNIWTILGILAVIFLVIFSKKTNNVWAGLVGGFIVGLIIAIIYAIKGQAFPWSILMKAAIIGILASSLFIIGRRVFSR